MPQKIEAILDQNDNDDLDQDMLRPQVVMQLNEIANQTAMALEKHGFEVPIFFLPSRGGGRSLISFGITDDDAISDSDWHQISGIVKSVLEKVLGTGPLVARPTPCAKAIPGAHREEKR